MSNVSRLAAKDAARWAYAEMFFGEGAGTRRKLLSAEIATKVERISGYHEAFQAAFAKENMADHAIKAAKERKRIDGTKFLTRNAKALITGNKQSMTAGVAVLVTVGYVAHQTGLDEIVLQESKVQYHKGKKWVSDKKTLHKAKRNLRSV